MQLYRGRLFDHVHVAVPDLARSRRFYAAVMEVLGIPIVDMPQASGFYADELWVTDQGEPTGRMHFAFQADDRGMVERFHAAGVKVGAHNNGAPGERDYHPGYYAAFLLDPDGNNVEAVYHGEGERSAKAIEISF